MTRDTKEYMEREEQRSDRRLSTADMADTARMTKPPEAEHDAQQTPLLSNDALSEFRTRWDQIQTGFVDEPRRAVEDADSLVAELMQYLARTFADERQNLEGQWTRGDDVSTEDLRIALQRYRFFFSRLLAV
jgi:hypothetical protein